jgi:hypothetical protein
MRRHKNGTFRYNSSNFSGLRLLIVTVAIGAFINWLYAPVELHRPIAGEVIAVEPKPSVEPTTQPPDDIQMTDYWVQKYVDKYFKTHYGRSRMRATMQCLLNKESQHTFMDADDHHGDSGKAGGILQYHEPTWTGFRKIMIERGLVTEIGSRYNPEQAIETTVWALSDGRERNWGPINVGDCLSVKGAK